MTNDPNGSAAMAAGNEPSRHERHCLDCPAPISRRSKGRCRRCANVVIGRNPERRAKAAATMKRRLECPIERARLQERTRAGISKRMEDPAFVERKRELGRIFGAPNIRTCHTAAVRVKAGRTISATKLAHIPPRYRSLYNDLRRQHFSAAERRRLVAEQEARDLARGRAEVEANAAAMRERAAREKASRY